MKKIVFAALAALGLVYAGAAFAGGVPLIPSTSQFSEPSQILNTLNTFIQTLNGQTTAIGTPGNVLLGKFCTGSSSTTAVTCNGSHGILSLTSVGDLASAGYYVDYVLTNTNVTAGSACSVQVLSGGAAGSAPTISKAVPTANTLTFRVLNGSSIATGAAGTLSVGFNCYQ